MAKRAASPLRQRAPDPFSLPAPYGGWNARDTKTEMDATDALVLDNFIPQLEGVEQRRGFSEHATGLTGNFVESLMEYNVAGANPSLFGAAGSRIFDVTSAGAASAVVTGLTNARWQHTMFSAGGGNYLVICNGADSVRNWNGSAWSTPTINNVTSSTLINVTSHLSRLWFAKSASLEIWYLDVGAVSGDATKLDLAPISVKGGQLMAMASWSRDGGSGLDDYFVAVTSAGELFIYQGTDPDSANTWSLKGRWEVPKPVGRRCFIKLGADLCYLSERGVLPLPQFLAQNSAGLQAIAVTDKISGAFIRAYRAGSTLFGWQVLEYSREGLLIVNVPQTERSVQHQYIVNLRTGACCRFTGINAGCWSLKGDTLYFGGNDGVVYAYGGTGVYDDDGDPVEALAVQAFNRFGTSAQKHFRMARPLMSGPEGYAPQLKMLIDYDSETLPTFDPTAYEEIGPRWDEELWDTELWATGLAATNLWQGVTGAGVVGAVALASSVTTRLIWNQTDVVFEKGGVL